jgi:hypothetical protein
MQAQIALALAVYHVGPALRSLGRISHAPKKPPNAEKGRFGTRWKVLEPWVYLVLHGVVGAELAWCGRGALF